MDTRASYILFSLVLACYSSSFAQKKFLVTLENLNVRKEPNISATTLGIIPKGERVAVLASNSGSWSTIHYDIFTGFVKTKYLRSEKKEPQETSSTSSNSISVETTHQEARDAVAKAKRIEKEVEHRVSRAIAEAELAHQKEQEIPQAKVLGAKNTHENSASTSSNHTGHPTNRTMRVTKVIESETKQYALWKKKSYPSGATPKSFDFKGTYDYTLANYLKIHVGANTDVIVKLYKMGSSEQEDECIRIAYIKHNTSFAIRHIPEGKYYVKIAYGKDWRELRQHGKIVGTFTKNALYQKGGSLLDFYTVKTDSKIHLPSYNLSLNILDDDPKYQNNQLDMISSEAFYAL